MTHGVKINNKFDETLFTDDQHLGIKKVIDGYSDLQYFDSFTGRTFNQHKIILPGGVNKTNALIFARPAVNADGVYKDPEAVYRVPWMNDTEERKHVAALRGSWPMAVTFNEDKSITFIAPDNAVSYYDGIHQSTNQPQFDTIRPLNRSSEMYHRDLGIDGRALCRVYYEIWVSGVDPDFDGRISEFNISVESTEVSLELTGGAVFVSQYFNAAIPAWRSLIFIETSTLRGFKRSNSAVRFREPIGMGSGTSSSDTGIGFPIDTSEFPDAPQYEFVGDQPEFYSGPVGIDYGHPADFTLQPPPQAVGFLGGITLAVWSHLESAKYTQDTGSSSGNFRGADGIDRVVTDCWWVKGKSDDDIENFRKEDTGYFVFGLEGNVPNNDSIFNSLWLNEEHTFLREEAQYLYAFGHSLWYWKITNDKYDEMPSHGTRSVQANYLGFVDYSGLSIEERNPTDTVGLKVTRPRIDQVSTEALSVFDSTRTFFRIEQSGYNYLGITDALNRGDGLTTTPFIDKNHIVPFRMYMQTRGNKAQLEYMACLNGTASAVAIISGGSQTSGKTIQYISKETGDIISTLYVNTDSVHEITGGESIAGTTVGRLLGLDNNLLGRKNETGYWRAFVEFHYQDEEDIYAKTPSVIQVPRLAYARDYLEDKAISDDQMHYEQYQYQYLRSNPQVGVKTLSIIGKTV